MCLPLGFCCCCLSLETGTKIISVGSTLFSLLVSSLYGLAASLPKQPESKRFFYAAMAATAFSHSIAGAFLICGAFWKKPRHMWPWILISWCWSILLLVAAVAGFALLHYTAAVVDDDVNYVVSTYVIFSGVNYYLSSVVNSRRVELLQGQLYSAVKIASPPQGAYSYTRPYQAWRYV